MDAATTNEDALARLTSAVVYDALKERLLFVQRSCVRFAGISRYKFMYEARCEERAQLYEAIRALEALLSEAES